MEVKTAGNRVCTGRGSQRSAHSTVVSRSLLPAFSLRLVARITLFTTIRPFLGVSALPCRRLPLKDSNKEPVRAVIQGVCRAHAMRTWADGIEWDLAVLR